MSSTIFRTTLLAVMGFLVACGKAADTSNTAAGATATSQASTATAVAADTMGATLSAADVRTLAWLKGTWKGTGDVPTPFYEQYELLNDSTLRVYGFTDSTLAVANDTSVFTLRAGRFGNHDKPSRYVAKLLDRDHIEFVPVNARNGFIWRRKDADSWQAVIVIPAMPNAPAKERNYAMTRFRR